MIKNVLFDFDDTLVDTFNSKIPAIIEYCATVHGTSITADQVRSLLGIPFGEMMRALTNSQEIDTQRYLEISQRHPLSPFPESKGVLEALQSRFQVGIVTSLSRPVLVHSLNVLGWNTIPFATLVAEGEAPAHKPNPRVFEPAIQALGSPQPREILYIGDALTDAQAATQAGLRFIGVGRDPQRQAAFTQGGYEWRSSLSDITRTVRPRELHP
jgi:HAD superfamily hydrolase (TIGR01549 family)